MFYGNVEAYAFEEVDGVQEIFKIVEARGGHRQLGVDALLGHVDTTQYLHVVPVEEEVVSKNGRVLDAVVLIKRKRQPFGAGGGNQLASFFST